MSNSATKGKFARLRQQKAGDPRRRAWRNLRERTAFLVLGAAAVSSVFITAAIGIVLVTETWSFFTVPVEEELPVTEVREPEKYYPPPWEFFTGTQWSPATEFKPHETPPQIPHVGILALVSATVTTTLIALGVALPVGTIVALYLSEFAPFALRETIKPTLELLSAVPTVVYGYFALTLVSPILQAMIPGLALANMFSAGIVMGIMIIPYVSSLSEDAMRSVPMLLREGSYALGGNKLVTALRVVVPSALSGIGAAYILGISRAIGETMIVALAAGMQSRFTFNPLEQAQTITAFIVSMSQGETPHNSIGYRSIFAAGMMLFVLTLIFNVLGYWLRRRYHQAY